MVFFGLTDGFARFQGNKKDSGVLGNPALVVVIYFQDLLPLNLYSKVRAEGARLTVSNCPGPPSLGCSPVMKEFADILAENTHVNRWSSIHLLVVL